MDFLLFDAINQIMHVITVHWVWRAEVQQKAFNQTVVMGLERGKSENFFMGHVQEFSAPIWSYLHALHAKNPRILSVRQNMLKQRNYNGEKKQFFVMLFAPSVISCCNRLELAIITVFKLTSKEPSSLKCIMRKTCEDRQRWWRWRWSNSNWIKELCVIHRMVSYPFQTDVFTSSQIRHTALESEAR